MILEFKTIGKPRGKDSRFLVNPLPMICFQDSQSIDTYIFMNDNSTQDLPELIK